MSNLRVYKVCYFRKYLYCLLNWHTSIGAIKTGCMKTPAFNSRFCELHRPRAILASTGGTAAEKDQPGPSYQLPPDSGGSPVIKFIAGKRTTRSGVYYQVKYTQVTYIHMHHAFNLHFNITACPQGYVVRTRRHQGNLGAGHLLLKYITFIVCLRNIALQYVRTYHSIRCFSFVYQCRLVEGHMRKQQ